MCVCVVIDLNACGRVVSDFGWILMRVCVVIILMRVSVS